MEREYEQIKHGLNGVLAVPRGRQAEALSQLRESLTPAHAGEAWNTRFSSDSLYDAGPHFR